MNIGGKIRKQLLEDRKKAQKKAVDEISSKIYKSLEEKIKDKPVEDHQKIINEFLIKKIAELTLDVRATNSRSLVRG